MNFFRPSKPSKPDAPKAKMTSANIRSEEEERLKQIQERRAARREEYTNEKVSELDLVRKNRNLTRSEIRKNDFKEFNRKGPRPKQADEIDSE